MEKVIVCFRNSEGSAIDARTRIVLRANPDPINADTIRFVVEGVNKLLGTLVDYSVECGHVRMNATVEGFHRGPFEIMKKLEEAGWKFENKPLSPEEKEERYVVV